jgi:3-hydroxyisobutyrate dehydrogenase-like beta-hydroxyacid dehydrogenase
MARAARGVRLLTTRAAVGFVGVGRIGGPLARRVEQAGFPVTVVDRSPAASAAFQNVAPSAAAVAARSEIVVVAVADGTQLDDAVCGPAGVLAGARPSAVVVVHSTVGPEAVRELAAACSARGVALLDAPVTGGESSAANGRLAAIVGGDGEALMRARPVLEAYCHSIVPVGAVGAGQVVKLLNNLLSLANTVAVAQALALAAALGVPDGLVREVALVGSGASHALRTWDDRRSLFDAGPNERRLLALKDLGLAMALAADVGIDLTMAESALEALRRRDG